MDVDSNKLFGHGGTPRETVLRIETVPSNPLRVCDDEA